MQKSKVSVCTSGCLLGTYYCSIECLLKIIINIIPLTIRKCQNQKNWYTIAEHFSEHLWKWFEIVLWPMYSTKIIWGTLKYCPILMLNVICNIFHNKIQVKLHTTTLTCTFMPYNMLTQAWEFQRGLLEVYWALYFDSDMHHLRSIINSSFSLMKIWI
jgi:hypothetical protein